MSASVNTKKSSVNSEFLRKTAEYLKGGVINYVTDSMYTVTSTYKESKDTYDEIKSKISSKRESVLPVVRQMKSQMNLRGITNWFLQRESEYDDDEPSGPEKQEWDDGTEPSNINEGTPTLSEEDRNANKIAKTTLESTHKLIEAQISTTANVVTTLNEQTAAITAGFDKVDKTLGAILEVVTKNTAAMIEVTTAATAAQMSANEKMMNDGKFSLSNYKDLIKENFNSSELGVAYTMLGTFFNDPNNFKPDRLVALGIEKAFNAAAPNFKKNLEALDQAVSDTIMSSLIRIGERSSKSSDFILGPLGKLFGIDATRKEFDGTQSNLELKSVPFDTVTKEAITGAIPGYLRKILVAVGGDDLVYDYRSRSFKSQSNIRRDFLESAVKMNNLNRASDNIKNKLGNEDYTKMMYDLMINDLSSKSGNNWSDKKYGEINSFIAALSDPKNAEKYLTGLLGKNATAADKQNIKILAERFSTLDQYDLQNGIGLQAKQYAIDRNIRTRKYGETAENYGMDLSNIKDNKWQDANYIMERYDRIQKQERSGGASVRGSRQGNLVSGIDYTNRALFEIYRKLNEGLNVYQVTDGPFENYENLLPPPLEYRPKTINKKLMVPKVSELSGGNAINPYSDEENDLLNHELEDGTTEDLSKAQRAGRWGKKRGRQFIGAMIGGSGDDVRNVLTATFKDVADIAGNSAKSGLNSINNSFGNVTGYLKHQMFGSGYSYQEDTGKVDENGKPIYKTQNVKPNEKAGLFGFFKEEVRSGWDNAKNHTKDWYQEVSGYFDDLKDGDSKSRDVNTKRKKLIGASIGAFAGLGILGGPIGALVGGIAGNAIASSSWASEIHDKLFGRDEDSGDATGFLSKAFDKIMDPIKYQLHKTMNFVSNTLKKHVFGPLSDLGFAIKERMLGHVKSIGKRMHEWFEKTWLGQKLKERKEKRKKKREERRKKRREFFGKVTDKLFGFGAGAAGGLARGSVGAAGYAAHGVVGGLARGIIGTDFEMQKKLTERQRAREEKMNLNETESYEEFVKNSHKKKADRRKRFKNGGYTSEDASEEIASNTASMAETQAEIKSGVDQITGEIIPGSSFKTHDQGIHDRLDKLIELLGGNRSAKLDGYNEEDIIDVDDYSNAKSKISGMANEASGFAQSALSSVVSMGMSGDSIDDDEKALMSDVIKEASGDNPNSSNISQKMEKMINLQGKKKEGEQEKEEEKQGFFSKILGFLGGAGGILANIGKIAAAVGAFYLLFKNDGLKTIAKNISGMMKTDEELKAAGTDASTLGMNTATALVDSQVDSKWDWLNPFKSINHNSTDAAGNSITNTGMTQARNNLFLANGLKKFQTGTTFRQDYFNWKSDRAYTKGLKYEVKGDNALTSFGQTRNYNKAADAFDQSTAYTNEANSFRSTNAGQFANAAANIAGISIMSKGAGGITEWGAKRLGASDDFAEKVGNTTTGITSAGLTVNAIHSAAKGKTSIAQKVVDVMAKLLGKFFETVGASDKLAKLAGKVGQSSLATGLKEAKDNILKAVSTGVKNAGESLTNKLNQKLAEAGLGDILTVTTGGLMIAAGAVVGAISGFCGTEHLFGVLNGQADAKMKLISTVIESGMRAAEMVPGVGWIVACFDVIDGLVQGILGCGIKQFIARKLYELISLDGGASLAEKQQAFSDEKDYYNQKFGTNLSDAAFNDMTNNTGLLSRVWSGKAKLGDDGHYQYDEDGNLIKSGGLKNALTAPFSMFKKDKKEDDEETSEISGYDKASEEDDNKISSKLKSAAKIGGKTLITSTAMAGGGIFGLAAIGALKSLKNKFADQITSVTSAISGYEEEQFITDEDGNPVEYATDEDGKPLSEDGSRFVKKGNLGDLVISGLLKVTQTIISPIDEMEKGIDEYNKKKSPWAKDGSSNSGNWLSNTVGKLWGKVTDGFKSLGDVDVSVPDSTKEAASASAVGGPAEGTDASGAAKETPEGGNPLNKDYKITSKFGPRTYPHNGNHTGVDLVPSDGSKDADIGSRYKGVVTDVKSDVPDTDTASKDSSGNWQYKGNNATGNMVIIESEDGKVIKNMHIKAGSIPSNIKPGAKVNVGDKLGKMGSTGWSTGAHLHYQIEEGGSPVDPASYLSGSTMKAFNTNSAQTIEAAPVDNSSFTSEDGSATVSSTTSSTSTTSSSSSSDSSTSSDDTSSTSYGSGPLGSLLSALRSAGSKLLSKLTGGLLGSDDSSSSDGASVSDSSSSSSSNSDSTHGGSGASRTSSTSSDQGKYFTTTANTQWVAVVRKIKELVAAKKPTYNQSGSMTINVDGQDLTVRPDCTGIIAAMLKVYGAIPTSKNIYSALLLQDGAIDDKFDKMAWPGWNELIEGDIIARNGHAEIFASNEGDTHYVYNGGSTDALCSAGATKTGHRNGYDVIWRCREAGAELADGTLTGEIINSDNPLVNSAVAAINTAGEAASAVIRKSSGSRNITDKQGLWNYLKSLGYTDYAVAGIMGAWSEETDNRADRVEGDYLGSFPGAYSVLENNDTLNEWTQKLFGAYDRSGISINRDAYKGSDGNLYPGVGIAQWTGPRGKELFDFAKERGEDWRDFAPQLDFFKQEYDSSYDPEHILNTKDSPSSAAEFFAKKYENSNMPSDMLYNRKAAAEDIYKQYADSNNEPTDGDEGMGGPETSSIAESRYVPSNISNRNTVQRKTNDITNSSSSLPSTISSTVSNMTSAINDAMQTLDTNKQQTIDTGEIVTALYRIITLLEVGNSNTGQSNTLLSSLSQLRNSGGNNQTSQRNGNIPRKQNSTPYYASRNSNNNRMITNMARPN